MNKRSLSIFLLSLFLSVAAFAQLDSRQRTPQTVISDGLAQLPANTPAKYNEVIGEMAATGAHGVEMIADMLKPADKNKNATFEYAIDAIVSYVTREDNAALRQGVHDGLVAAVKKCSDNANKAFLLTELNKLAQPADFDLYVACLGDSYLKHHAAIGLAAIPGIDDKLAALINSAAAPDASLAYIAYFKKLKAVEPALLAWTAKTNDPKVLDAIYNALAVCGSDASLPTLQNAAKAVAYGNDPTGATDAYIRLIGNIGSDKAAVKAAKELTSAKMPQSVRCAGLTLLLNADSKDAAKNVLAALKDKDIQYRNTALLAAPAAAGEGIFDAVAAKFKSLSPEAKIDVINWLGNNHVASQVDLIAKNANSSDEALAIASVKALPKVGGEKALAALISLLSADEAVAKAAEEAVKSFNGDVNASLIAAIDSQNEKTRDAALRLVLSRRVFDAYPKVLELAKNGNPLAALALTGIAKADNFNEICDIMEASDDPAALYGLVLAAKNALLDVNNDETAFFLIDDRMNNVKEERLAYLYYPLLAFTGTPQGIGKLFGLYNQNHDKVSLSALLTAEGAPMINILYTMALDSKTAADDLPAIYNRIVTLTQKYVPGEQALPLYNIVLDCNPSDDIVESIIKNIAAIHTAPALMTAAKYLDNPKLSFAAANTVRTIVAKNEALQQGPTVKAILEKANKIFAEHKAQGDADAGYAMDDIKGIMDRMNPEGGFNPVEPVDGLVADEAENFEIYFDWKGAEPATVVLRSMPIITLDPAKGLVYGEKNIPLTQGWNNVHIRMVNDRIFVDVNGAPAIVNEIVKNVPADKAANYTGQIALGAPAASFRNVLLSMLPDTPVFELSDEEKALGFEVLFDGRSLDKWHGNTSAYVPVDGCIYVTAQYGGSGNLYTKKNFSDFVYRFEFFFDVPAVNNGIGIRTGKDVTGVDAAFHGMEIQVLDHDDPVYQGHPFGYKGLQPYQNHGSVYGVVPSKHVDFGPIKQWHTEEIRAIGDQITVTVDGEVILDANIRDACQGHNVSEDGGPNPYMIDHRNHPGLFNKEGYISFCGHGSGVKFRNVRVLDLSDAKKAKAYKKHISKFNKKQ